MSKPAQNPAPSPDSTTARSHHRELGSSRRRHQTRPVQAASAAWDVRKVGSDEYVSTDNIKQFYRFTTLTRKGNAITLENPKVVMRLTVGSTECTMNRVKFELPKLLNSGS